MRTGSQAIRAGMRGAVLTGMTLDERDDRSKLSPAASMRRVSRAEGRGGENQGEGPNDNDYGAAAGRRYDHDVRRFVAGGQVDAAAHAARRAVEGPDGPALHDAEIATARHGAMPGDPPWVAKVRAAAHLGVDRALSGLVYVKDWIASHLDEEPPRH